MIDFNQEHPFENAIGEYLLYNRGKQSKSKWKLDAKQPFEDYNKQFLPKLNKTSTQWAIKCGPQLNGSYIIGIDFDIYSFLELGALYCSTCFFTGPYIDSDI